MFFSSYSIIRSESGNGWSGVTGSYSLNVGDGRSRVVNYVADGAGFRAAIATNEQGTAAQPGKIKYRIKQFDRFLNYILN